MGFDNVRVFPSSEGTVFKHVFTGEGVIAEAVLYRYPTFEERTVICCSTQSGCPVGCSFCGTGKRFVRNLTSEEIVFQIESALTGQGIDASKVKKLQFMFMSMGEPMLNFPNVAAAIRQLFVKYPNADLLISTMAPKSDHWNELIDLALEVPRVGLQFSVHESTDKRRDELIPFKLKLDLRKICEKGTQFFAATGRKPYFNYCAHKGNTSEIDAKNLWHLFWPKIWNATVSVICEKDESMKAAHERQEALASGFMARLLEYGFNVRVFNPAGQDDIGGGCGQLWFTQDWLKENKRSNKEN